MTDGALKQFVTQIESVNQELKSLTTDRTELYRAAQQQGYDPKILRRVIAERALDTAERVEADELFRAYWDAVHEARELASA